jgi:hypothetical protein
MARLRAEARREAERSRGRIDAAGIRRDAERAVRDAVRETRRQLQQYERRRMNRGTVDI